MNVHRLQNFVFFALLSTSALAQQEPVSAPSNTPNIKVETREVLVDTVVTDKKGNYMRGLTAKDFKVWEDNKEQAISSFSYEEDGAAGPAKPHYMVLFFDNSTMDFAGQAKARDAAAKFLDANAGPNRLIAIAEFGGSLYITQNFTSDADRLKKVVASIQGTHVNPNTPPPVQVASLTGAAGMPQLSDEMSRIQSNFGIRSVMLALRDLAKGLSNVPGRKTVVMLTEGFPLTPEYQAELTATIDACNHANVAIYPIDVRGLVAPGGDTSSAGPQSRLQRTPLRRLAPRLTYATLAGHDGNAAHLITVGYQRGGGGVVAWPRWRRWTLRRRWPWRRWADWRNGRPRWRPGWRRHAWRPRRSQCLSQQPRVLTIFAAAANRPHGFSQEHNRQPASSISVG